MESFISIDQASRPIMWNIEGAWNVVLMYTLLALSLAIFGMGVLRHLEFWLSGTKAKGPAPSLLSRISNFINWALLQKGVRRKTYSGLIIHGLMYTGFLALLFATTIVMIEFDLGIPIFHGPFYLGISLAADVLGFGVIIACLLAIYRRKITKPDMLHSRTADTGILYFIILLCIQGFVLEGLRIAATADSWSAYSPVGRLLADFFLFMPADFLAPAHYLIWWFHTISVFIGLALIPYSKFWHVFSSSANLFCSDFKRPKAALNSPGDLELLMEKNEELKLGLQDIKDYSRKELMDLDACTSCGRCQEVCPAYLSGKVLSPKWLILDSRNHALSLHSRGLLETKFKLPKFLKKFDSYLNQKLFRSLGLNSDGQYTRPEFRGQNPLVQQSARSLGQSAEQRIASEVLDENVFWSCTTCMACVQACPVGINHLDQIIGNRQNLTMMQGELPKEAQNMLRMLENQGQTFQSESSKTAWLEELGVKFLQPGDQVDYLYWIGCVTQSDPRKQKIAKALIKIMQKAGLNFGVLGEREKCCGDPARRLGNEMLFQMTAKQNITELNQIKFKNVVANCPHCFNSLKNEYPQFGKLSQNEDEPLILHHTQLIRELLDSGKLKIKEHDSHPDDSYTFHDPCYLARGNNEYEAPREVLRIASSGNPVEMKMNREQAMCCGAGGGHYWMDLKQGQRINALRVDQAAETGAKIVATACPYCLQMMEDGVKLTNRDADLQVKDIAEFIFCKTENE